MKVNIYIILRNLPVKSEIMNGSCVHVGGVLHMDIHHQRYITWRFNLERERERELLPTEIPRTVQYSTLNSIICCAYYATG